MSLRVPSCHILHIARTAPTRYSSCVRAFSFSRRVAAEAENEGTETPAADDLVAIPPVGEEPKATNTRDLDYEAWIEIEGERWKHPDPLGPKWLGRDVPFPLNPTFKPPTPVSDALRTMIYTSFVANPNANDLRTLSTRYGLAIKRVEAIIRLKALEEQWKKSKPLQTGFLKGMERLLGLNVGGQPTPVNEEVKSESRKAVALSDEVSRQTTESGNERKRGISRTFFEPVDEGQPSLVSSLLEVERVKAHRSGTDPSTYPSIVVQPDLSKPPIKFVDVGLRWVNHTDVERRAKESTRRKAVKSARKGSLRRQAID